MAFELANAQPVDNKPAGSKQETKKFDLSNATPVNPVEMAGRLLPKNIGLNILGRTVEDIGKAAGTVVGVFSPERGRRFREEAVIAGRGIGDPESAAYQQSGMLPATVVGLPVTMGLGRVAAAAAPVVGRVAPRVQPFIEDVATTIRSGGFEPGARVSQMRGIPGVAARTASRAAGGATAAGATAGLIEPDAALDAAMIGAGLPIAGATLAPAARNLGNWLMSYISPERVAANALIRQAGGADISGALSQTAGMQATPGLTPSLSERLFQGGVSNPTIASLERSLPGSYPNVNRQIYEQQSQNVAALRDQVARAEDALRQQANALAPQPRNNAEQAIASLRAKLQAEETSLANMRAGMEQPLGARGQLGFGTAIGERAGELKREVRKTVVEPAYEQAFSKAGNAKAVDPTPMAAKAEEIFGMPLSDVPRGTSFTATEFGKLPRDANGNLLPVTLKQADDLRKAINLDLAAANTSTAPAAATQLRGLAALHKEIDNAVAGSNLSDDAKAAYRSALQTYREQFVPRFKTGLQVDILGNTRKNVPRLIPDRVVNTVISNESGVAQYTAMFKNDPQANAALKAGIEDLYEQQLAQSADSAASWLTRHRKVFDDLEAQGVDVRSGLKQTQQRFVTQQENEAALASLQNQFGAKNAGELIDTMLQSSANLTRGLKAMDATGQRAFAQELSDRAMSMVEAGDYAGAIKFLTDKGPLIKQALGAANPRNANSVYDELMETANFGREIERVKKQLPEGMKPTAVNLRQNYTPEQLADLQVVANDLRRSRQVSDMAEFGSQTPKPVGARAATEEAEQAGISATGAPTPLSAWFSVARVIWKELELGVNKRTAVVLARWMYQDPDAAIAALQAAQKRAASRTQMQSSARKTTGMLATGAAAGKATNAFASQNQNALSE